MHPEDELKKQLQKTFSVLKQCRNGFEEMEAKAVPCVKTIVNLTEQFQCCESVSISDLPLNIDFNEVKQKLLFKISTEISENISKLQTLVYEEYSNSMGRQYNNCMSKCAKCSDSNNLPELLERSPLYPSVTDMLEWIEVSEKSIRETYLCKKFIVDTFTPEQPGICDSSESSWKEGDKDLYNQLDGYIALTSHFLELKIT